MVLRNLTFAKALELVMDGMYIRSNIMSDGVYLEIGRTGSLVVVDGFNINFKLETFILSKNSYNATWTAFNIVNKENLTTK